MSKLIKIIFVLGLLMPAYLQAQIVTWQKIYNYNEQRTFGRDIQQTNDGGFIICGTTTTKVYLIKINNLGIKEWEKLVGDSTGNDLYANSIQQTSDSGFVMTGRNEIDLSIIRTDKIGNLLWKKNFNLTNGEAIGTTIKITSDGGFIVCGDLFSISNEKAYVVKTDTVGNLEWEKSYGDSIVNKGFDILQSEGKYFLTGISAPNFAQQINGYIYKIDPHGNIIWKKYFPQFQSTTRILKLNSTNLVLTGQGYSSGIFFAKVDSLGNVLNNHVIPTTSPGFFYSSMCLNASEQIVVCGNERYPEKIGDFVYAAAVVDTAGHLLYEKKLNSPANFYNSPYSVRYTSDDGYIFVGDTEYQTEVNSGETHNILIAKTDSAFNTPNVVKIQNIHEVIANKDFALYQNYPNPFNPTTTISYSIPKSGNVKITIYDALGRKLLNW